MPMMQLHRSFRLATLKGHSVRFEKNTPTHVPNEVVAEAIAIGAIVVDGEEFDVTPKDAPKPNAGPAEAAVREEQILDAINALVMENDRESFTAGGIPKDKAVSGLVGYRVQKSEVMAVWMKRSELIAAGQLTANGMPV
jgi:hypothetical protein